MRKPLLNSKLLILLIGFLSFYTSQAQNEVETLDAYFQKALEDWNIPGMSIGVIQDGKVILAKGYGVTEAGSKQEVDQHTNYAIASNTKAFTSAILGVLVDAGKLKWDDKVTTYLPSFKLASPYETEAITIRDLLCHRVGFGNFSGDVVWYKSERSAYELLASMPYVPTSFEFRDGYGYSNLMFITAGEIIYAVTGKTWAENAKELFFDPLGMDRTVTSTTTLKNMQNVASPHKPDLSTNQPIPWVNWDNMGAAGGIISNVDDMNQWMQLQLDHGIYQEDTIFSRSVQIDWWTMHNVFPVSDASKKLFPTRNFSGYGLAWGIQDYAGYKVVRHGGGYDGMYSQVLMVPEANIGIVILTNSMKSISSYLSYKVLDELLDSGDTDWSELGIKNQIQSMNNMEDRKNKLRNSRVKNTKMLHSMEDFAGIYKDDMYRKDIEVKFENGILRLYFGDAPGLTASLQHWNYDSFEIIWDEPQAWFDFGIIQFTSNSENQIDGIEFDVPNGDIFFNEIHAKK